ncbi:MAG TPA: hypothetical protein VFM01_15455 [Nakamurella sp.]|nr:hypothetical protein [Nakamurella sp.]
MTESFARAGEAIRYLPGGTFSSGLAVESGYRLVEWELGTLLPLASAFDRVSQELGRNQLTWQAVAGIDLRSPAPLPPAEFAAFNVEYSRLLGRHYPQTEGAPMPLTRTNVAVLEPFITEPSVRAVQVVIPDQTADGGDFVLSGLAEITGSPAPDNIVAYHDTSETGLRRKVDHIVAQLVTRLAALGISPADASIVDVYAAQPMGWLETVLASTFTSITRFGVHRWPALPPVADLEIEIGCKRLSARHLID